MLRPLKGLENNLYENLESTFRQEYHNYEIFFCVADPDDQALPVVRALIAKYPNIKATIVIGMIPLFLQKLPGIINPMNRRGGRRREP